MQNSNNVGISSGPAYSLGADDRDEYHRELPVASFPGYVVGISLPVRGPAIRPVVEVKKRVLLLETEPWLNDALACKSILCRSPDFCIPAGPHGPA